MVVPLFVLQKILWLILALFLCICGVIGLLLPVIPQVPFFIGAAWSLTKASPRFESWLHSRRWYQQTILHLIHTKRKWAKKFDGMLQQRQINWQWLTRQWQVDTVPIDDDQKN